MKRSLWILLSIVTVFAMTFSVFQPAAASATVGDQPAGAPKQDNRPDPLTDKQLALKSQALDAQLNGKAHGKTMQVARGQYVELAREGEDAVWTVLGEFADLAHNTIAKPEQTDNTTLWMPDFNQAYYQNMLFAEGPGVNSMRQFYLEQSSNRYTVKGGVTDWVKVPGAAAGYDDDISGPAVWQFLIDSLNGWYDAQIAAGKTPAQIDEYLSQFDKQDRYDYNGNGNFNEPDGYIDHFQSLHAGEGNEAGGGVLGDAAIWSHSWYAYSNLAGKAGPDFNKLGGVQVGKSKYWVGKYTIQPENGGVGVFTHEFGHDLGLPDLYDTAGGENGTGFWTLMSSGSWLGDGTKDIGSKPGHMGVWEKFELGWLNYQVASAGKKADFKLGPAEYNTKQAQSVIVILPKKSVVANLGTPFEGTKYYYSGAGDDLDYTMSKPVTLTAGSTLTAMVKYNIELDWDYAYVVVSTDNGVTWKSVPTTVSTTTDPNGQNFGFGITGASAGWVPLTADLSGYTGNVLVGFRYWTDANTGGFGFMIDNISIAGSPVDGAETDGGWTYKPATGFHVTNGVEGKLFSHYYVTEYRTYMGFDSTLKVGPYNFGFLDNPLMQNTVEHFPYQDGLLIHYWDTSQKNNNTSQHAGMGLILPIDAHPAALMRPDGNVWRNRVQSYDSTFGLQPTDALTLHFLSQPSVIASQPAVPVFDDRNLYFDAANPRGSVKNPNTGTIIEVRSISALDGFMQIQVRPAK